MSSQPGHPSTLEEGVDVSQPKSKSKSKSMKERMMAGELYKVDEELMEDEQAAQHWMATYNASMTMRPKERHSLLVQGLGSVGEGSVIRPPFFCDIGKNIHIGKGVTLNFNCVILDVCRVEIGALTQVGPAVQIYAADHPRNPALRKECWESGKAVRIGENCWIGGGAIFCPGVTIGNDVIVGAGAVVTKSFGDGVTIVGNPARVIKKEWSGKGGGQGND